jgi:hypothetical protein
LRGRSRQRTARFVVKQGYLLAAPQFYGDIAAPTLFKTAKKMLGIAVRSPAGRISPHTL